MPRFGRSEPSANGAPKNGRSPGFSPPSVPVADGAPKNPWPAIWLLVGVACAYFGFHAIREELPPGFIRTALPSLLTPLGMFGVVELLPNVRFGTRRIKWLVLGATTLVAAVWLEALVPRLTQLASGAWQDVLAMGLGFAFFCGFDWLWGNVNET